ncbi:flagellar biosynthesis protein FlgG [Helicobacter monodelphidis]|uniref:flagellar hook-basal body protein n=1 Tax=Helicobacter sp. 15-1451 TaxID=2004995 RepID=UPI000DCE0559|nr:flagellar hook-basal body protein [Helicobacter sp. 15-1451]RAX58682.1 flagellar biosynthesis protein FlgG [Helicobacter sp. 15-1451]
MQTGFYNATGGMVTQMNRLDVISNNLANLNTSGFKRDDVVIGDFVRLYETKKNELPIDDQTKEAAKYLNRALTRVPHVVEEYTDISAGAVQTTDNVFDFALLQPNAYFMIETPEGVRYTRDGSFTLNHEGRLVTKEGFPVLPKEYVDGPQYIDIPEEAVVNADKDGNLYVKILTNETLNETIPLGNLAVVGFENPQYLEKTGGNLYKYPEERDAERTFNEGNGTVMQYALEKSNVNAVLEMTGLIETQRLVEMYSKVINTHMDDLNNEAINKLAQKA